MLARNTLLCLTVLAGGMAVAHGVGSPVYAQGTFLERLEATVREQLANPNGDAESAQSGSSEEELPSPPSSKSGSRPAASASILEGNDPLPAKTAPAAEADAAMGQLQPGRIYLGLEAEEITGGGIGVRVSRVTEDSPAWKGGIRVGDRISAVNGFAITNLDSMVEQLGKTSPGESVRFLVNRDDRNLQLVAVLMDAGLAENIARGPLPLGQRPAVGGSLPLDGSLTPSTDAENSAPWLGVSYSDLTTEFRRQFGLSVYRGAAVTSVVSQSPAAKVGIMAGDAITSIAGMPVESGRDLMLWLDTARAGQTVQIGYQRGTLPRTATLTLEMTPEARAANRPTAASQRRPREMANSPPAPPALDSQPTPSLELTVPPPLGQSEPGAVRAGDVVPNVIPTAKGPGPADVPRIALPAPENDSESGAESDASSAAEIARLQNEVSRLRNELQKANQRLESTQNRLQQILEGLGKE